MRELLRCMVLGSLGLAAVSAPAAAAARGGVDVDPEASTGSTMAARVLAAAGLTPPGGPGSNIAWGTRLGWKWISANELTPGDGSTQSAPRLIIRYDDGFYYPDPAVALSGVYMAALDLDPGLHVYALNCVVDDQGPATDLQIEWRKYRVDDVTDAAGFEILAELETNGTPGYANLTLFAPADEITHVWEPGTGELVRHVVRAIVGQDTAIAGCGVLYGREVAPGPDTATFDDVPVGHPFFEHIEALVATGVTAGCDADSYCPGAPLTRGQMAVFLARALGMGYPQ